MFYGSGGGDVDCPSSPGLEVPVPGGHVEDGGELAAVVDLAVAVRLEVKIEALEVEDEVRGERLEGRPLGGGPVALARPAVVLVVPLQRLPLRARGGACQCGRRRSGGKDLGGGSGGRPSISRRGEGGGGVGTLGSGGCSAQGLWPAAG